MRLHFLIFWAICFVVGQAMEACHIPQFPWYPENEQINGYILEGRGDLFLEENQLVSRFPVTVKSSTFELIVHSFILYEKSRKIKGKKITLRSHDITVNAKSGYFSLKSQEGRFSQLNFLLRGKKFIGRGNAEHLDYKKPIIEISEGIYTHCPKNQETWFIRAKKLRVDPKNQFVTLFEPEVNLMGHELSAGIDALKVNMSGQRTSGWMAPRVHINSKLGVSLGLPYFTRINDWSDVENTLYVFSHPAVALASKWRVMQGQFYLEAKTYVLPFDRPSKNASRGRFAAKVKLKSNPSLPVQYEGAWRYVGDKNWTKDFSWVGRVNQYFIPSYFEIKGHGEHYNWKASAVHYQFVPQDKEKNIFMYEKLPDISYEQFWDNLFNRSRIHLAAHGQYLKPVGVSSRTLPEGGRSFGFLNYEYTLGSSFYVHVVGGVKWLLHAPIDHSYQGMAVAHLSTVVQHDFKFDNFFLTPQVMLHWVPYHDQSQFPLYDTFSSHHWPFDIGANASDPDRIFDHSEIGFGFGFTSGSFRLKVMEQYAVDLHRICVDPKCEIDWLASHHWSPLSVESVYMSDQRSLQMHVGVIGDSPYVDHVSLSFVQKSADVDIKLSLDWQRKGYNLNRQEVVSSVSQVYLDLAYNVDDRYVMSFSPFFVNDGRQKLGYQFSIGYHDCCFSSSIRFSLAPRTWDYSTSFSHRPDVSFQLSFNP